MVSAIILAAGSSTRMQGSNKLLLPWIDGTVIRHTAQQILDAGIRDIIVVTGHEAAKVEAALVGLKLRTVFNPAYRSGMTGSIQSGVLAANGDAYMICLGDMVKVTAGEYAELVIKADELAASGEPFIVLPRFQKQKANPVIFSGHFRSDILGHTEPEGCKAIVESNMDLVTWLDMKDSNVLMDIDYREDYQKLLDGK